MLLFVQEAKSAAARIVRADGKFPDALINWNGIEYRAEFEFKALNFRYHQHDPRGADLIICWENDYPDSVLPVIALSEDNWIFLEPILPSEAEREAAYWKQRTELAESEVAGLKGKIKELTQEKNLRELIFECEHCHEAFATRQALNAHSPARCADKLAQNGKDPEEIIERSV
jgi:hypothetical protein